MSTDLATIPLADIERMGRYIAQSRLFGVQTPEQAIALMLLAQAEGRHPASVANDYHIIMGRPSLKSETMQRRFLESGGKIEWHAITDTIADATLSHPQGGSARIDWTMDRARKAGLLEKKDSQWSKYPRAMLRARVVSEGVRTVFPSCTAGFYTPEEVRDFANPDSSAIRETAYTGGVTIEATPIPEPEFYPEEKFEKNFPAWEKKIRKGSLTPDALFAMIEKAGPALSDEQKAKVEALVSHPVQAAPETIQPQTPEPTPPPISASQEGGWEDF